MKPTLLKMGLNHANIVAKNGNYKGGIGDGKLL